MKKAKIKSLRIVGKRWFQKLYGNTYHSVLVVVETSKGESLEFFEPFNYGYGEQYLQTAHEILVNNELFKGTYNEFYAEWLMHKGTPPKTKAVYDVYDVQRKKDL